MEEKKVLKKWIVCILIAVVSNWAINHLSFIVGIFSKLINIFLPFIIGGILAFMLNIPMTKIEKNFRNKIKGKNSKITIRILAIVLSLLLLILIITFVAFLLVPELIENIKVLIENIPALMNKGEKFILDLLAKYPDVQKEMATMFRENSNTGTIIGNVLNYIVNGAIGFISSLVSGISNIFTALVFAIYMLIQKEYLLQGIKKLLYAYIKKDKADKIMEIGALSNKTFSSFISGQCLEAVILGTIFFVVLFVFQFPYALLISVLIAITALIPIFGAFIAGAIGAILIAITSPIRALVFIIVFLVIQQIEGNFIYPKVVGKSVGLSPMLTLLAITVGGSIYGIIGMLLGLPIASIIYTLVRSNIAKKLKKNNA